MKPRHPYRLLSALVGTATIVTFGYIWTLSMLTDETLPPMWQVVAIVLVIVAAYAVYGHSRVHAAIEDVQSLKGDGGDDDSDHDDKPDS